MTGTSCIIDVETGGLKASHPTIQIAAVCVDNKTFEPLDEIEVKLIFGLEACDPEALSINCYDSGVWEREAIAASQARDVLARFFGRHQDYRLIAKDSGRPYKSARLIAHNAPFDVPRVQALWGKGFPPFCWWYPLDTVQMALWSFATEPDPECRPANFQLATLCQWFGIETKDAHDALADCHLVAKLLQRLHPPGHLPEQLRGLDPAVKSHDGFATF